jgi:hypothetical protein
MAPGQLAKVPEVSRQMPWHGVVPADHAIARMGHHQGNAGHWHIPVISSKEIAISLAFQELPARERG